MFEGNNSFEQMCINYANEKLQFHFNECIFRMELDVYKEEGIQHENITYKDNQRVSRGDREAGTHSH